MLSFTRQGTYEDKANYNWVYYGDDTNHNLFYIVPRPAFVMDENGNPVFQLVTYKTNDSTTNGSGYCSFQVQLTVPAEINQAIMSDIAHKFTDAPNPILNTLPYNPGNKATIYYYDAATQQDTGIDVTASDYGSNVASFLIHLDAKGVSTFTTAFSAPGGALKVTYAMSAPVRLPAVTAVLTFDSTIALNYQKTVYRDKNVWGETTSTRTEINETLSQSEASTVTITWGIPNPPQDLVDRVTSWANQELETLIANEVEQAYQAWNADHPEGTFDLSLVSSFNMTFSENMVINWYIQPTTTLPSLTDLGKTPANFFSTADDRQFVLTINANVPFATSHAATLAADGNTQSASPNVFTDGDALVENLVVTVTYPNVSNTKTKTNSYTFTANSDTATFIAPYDPTQGYQYGLNYTVTYSYKDASGKQQTNKVTKSLLAMTAAQYTISLVEAGILRVTFDGSHIGFGKDLDRAQVQFYFASLSSDQQPINEEFVLNATTLSEVVRSFTAAPIDTNYTYQVTYFLGNNKSVAAPSVTTNGPNIVLNSPFQQKQIGLLLTGAASVVQEVDVQVWFNDTPNLLSQVLGELTTSMVLDDALAEPPTESAPGYYTLTPPANQGEQTNRATFSQLVIDANSPFNLQATLIMADGSVQDIPQIALASNLPMVVFSKGYTYFTVQIDPGLIDWTKDSVQQVQVNLSFLDASGKPQQTQSHLFNPKALAPAYYSYRAPISQSLSYKWNATYSYTNESNKTIADTTGSNSILSLPPNPPAKSGSKESGASS